MHARRVLTRPARFVVLLVVIATLFACSGGNGRGGGGGRLSKREFTRRADAICADANKTIFAIGAPDLTDPEATSGAIRRLVTIQRQELQDLRDLAPPKTDKPAIDEWLDLAAKALREAEVALTALERSDRNGVNAANARGGEAQMGADDLAGEYGVTGCVSQQAEPPPTSAPR